MNNDSVAPAQWAHVSDAVAQHIGLHFPPERYDDLARGVRHAAQDLGLPDTAACIRTLTRSRMDVTQQQVLARHLTIGETYFLRDPHLLDALSRRVLPDLVRRRRGRDQRLRLWSAGCASGEEAYSLAILLHQLLPDIADWRVTITATDINPAALEKAAAGVYGEWSFRNVPASVKQSWFEQRPGGRYVVSPALRKLVNFEFLNLVADEFPPRGSETSAMDVIFCRNVLMYFTPPQVARAVARLHGSLVHGGWLAVSPSETSQDLFAAFSTVNYPGAILYRKSADAAKTLPTAPLAAHVAAAPVQAAPPSAARHARSLADEGRLAEALAWCERWVAADKLDPAAHYLLAMVLAEQGAHEGARASLRRAVFLEPGFVLAHFALGNIARQEGRGIDAARHFATVQRLLDSHQPGDLLPHGDGLNAGRLAHIVRSMPAGRDTS
ncbi:CheR family methyltransferase [Ramlibacter algicola]|uniref:Chemotaxis protein CheR n=1 Tax=Ramlibacter algicola TaxID=2795217 RepID=A0A934Q5Z4_9BURK|nr:protein-glutamate O-methyltransferase CheR [Ramlibacter algicola]MBK0394889.1 chemotaxis protein CheR [Ramlibacter algicola]